MIRLGCFIFVFLLVGLCGVGVGIASRHGRGAWVGISLGVATWLAIVGGYLSALSVVDWVNRKKWREGVPWWVIPVIWIAFIGASAGAVALYRHLAAA